ncbi:HSP20-like chaperone [Pycnococcus provasolii]
MASSAAGLSSGHKKDEPGEDMEDNAPPATMQFAHSFAQAPEDVSPAIYNPALDSTSAGAVTSAASRTMYEASRDNVMKKKRADAEKHHHKQVWTKEPHGGAYKKSGKGSTDGYDALEKPLGVKPKEQVVPWGTHTTDIEPGYEKPARGPTTNFVGNHMCQGAIDLVQSELTRRDPKHELNKLHNYQRTHWPPILLSRESAESVKALQDATGAAAAPALPTDAKVAMESADGMDVAQMRRAIRYQRRNKKPGDGNLFQLPPEEEEERRRRRALAGAAEAATKALPSNHVDDSAAAEATTTTTEEGTQHLTTPDELLHRASELVEMEKLDDALVLFKRVLELDPGNKRASIGQLRVTQMQNAKREWDLKERSGDMHVPTVARPILPQFEVRGKSGTPF